MNHKIDLNDNQNKLYIKEMDFDDGLPCGGYEGEDDRIREQISAASKECLGECKMQKCKKQVERKETKTQIRDQIKNVEQKRGKKLQICKKCKGAEAVLLSKGDPTCKDCILRSIEYKCRLAIQQKIARTTNVLICFSGGLSSICLAWLLASLHKRYQKHPLFSQIACIHILQQESIPLDFIHSFQSIVGLPLIVLPLQEGYHKSKNLFTMFHPHGNTVDLLGILRDRTILKYAREHKFESVLKGLNADSTATRTFEYFAKGLGGCVEQLVQGRQFHYPLRHHLLKELQYYFHVNRLSRLALKAQQSDLSWLCTQNIDKPIGQFVGALQAMYSHTVSAIVRTGEKIHNQIQGIKQCLWCLLMAAPASDILCRRCRRILQAKNQFALPEQMPVWMNVL